MSSASTKKTKPACAGAKTEKGIAKVARILHSVISIRLRKSIDEIGLVCRTINWSKPGRVGQNWDRDWLIRATTEATRLVSFGVVWQAYLFLLSPCLSAPLGSLLSRHPSSSLTRPSRRTRATRPENRTLIASLMSLASKSRCAAPRSPTRPRQPKRRARLPKPLPALPSIRSASKFGPSIGVKKRRDGSPRRDKQTDHGCLGVLPVNTQTQTHARTRTHTHTHTHTSIHWGVNTDGTVNRADWWITTCRLFHSPSWSCLCSSLTLYSFLSVENLSREAGQLSPLNEHSQSVQKLILSLSSYECAVALKICFFSLGNAQKGPLVKSRSETSRIDGSCKPGQLWVAVLT